MTAVGKPIDRVDGRRKITGAALYSAEHRPDRLVQGVLVTSTIAKGRVVSIDAADARRAPGVLAVLRHGEAPAVTKPKSDFFAGGMLGEERMPFEDDVISYAGQPVALVVAETLQQARFAASRVRVTYQTETPILDAGDPRAPSSFPAQSFGEELQYRRGDVKAALATPGVVRMEATYSTPVETHNPMELSATVAEWNGDRLVVHDATQYVMGTRAILAETFGIPREHVRVICPFVGGGFGCKGFQWPHTILAAMAARAVRRPVRIVLTRAQMFSSVGQARGGEEPRRRGRRLPPANRRAHDLDPAPARGPRHALRVRRGVRTLHEPAHVCLRQRRGAASARPRQRRDPDSDARAR